MNTAQLLDTYLMAMSTYEARRDYIYRRARDEQEYSISFTAAQQDTIEKAAQEVQRALRALVFAP